MSHPPTFAPGSAALWAPRKCTNKSAIEPTRCHATRPIRALQIGALPMTGTVSKLRPSFCCAPLLLGMMCCPVFAQSADVLQIMRAQAASTRAGEHGQKTRPVTVRIGRPAHRVAAARWKPSKLKAAPARIVSARSVSAVRVVSSDDASAIAPAAVADSPAGPAAAMSYGPTARQLISDAFDAIDRLEQERSLSAATSSTQDAAAASEQSNLFQWVWSGARDAWRTLQKRD